MEINADASTCKDQLALMCVYQKAGNKLHCQPIDAIGYQYVLIMVQLHGPWVKMNLLPNPF